MKTQNTFRHTPLHTASLNEHDKVVEILLATKANVDIQDKAGKTALDMVSWKRHDKRIEMLRDAKTRMKADEETAIN